MSTLPEAAGKPKLRGVLHQWAASCALGAGAVLIAMAPTRRTAAAAALYALSLVVLFAISATYHRVNWSVRARAWMRRLDHASIFLLIAGTYTPVAMVGLAEDTGNSLLLAIWGGALVGVLQSLFWVNAPKVLTAALAVAVGWTLVPYFAEARRALARFRPGYPVVRLPLPAEGAAQVVQRQLPCLSEELRHLPWRRQPHGVGEGGVR
jgi:hemolysin III